MIRLSLLFDLRENLNGVALAAKSKTSFTPSIAARLLVQLIQKGPRSASTYPLQLRTLSLSFYNSSSLFSPSLVKETG